MDCTPVSALNLSVSCESIAVPEYQPLTDRRPEINASGDTCSDCAAPITISDPDGRGFPRFEYVFSALGQRGRTSCMKTLPLNCSRCGAMSWASRWNCANWRPKSFSRAGAPRLRSLALQLDRRLRRREHVSGPVHQPTTATTGPAGKTRVTTRSSDGPTGNPMRAGARKTFSAGRNHPGARRSPRHPGLLLRRPELF